LRIALFVTCIGDTMFPEVARATVVVLERLGHEVVFPSEQTCCGQMHLNSGYQDDAARLARRFVDVFGQYELVVAPSSSCVGTVRELYPSMLGISHPVVDRVFELS
jgi:L-lactate dehydrogenase complex protein LldE